MCREDTWTFEVVQMKLDKTHTHSGLGSHGNRRLASPGQKDSLTGKADSICVIWQKERLDKQQSFPGLCFEEMKILMA